ncbi:MAG: glycosyltransferase [Pseudomonadota bacterium]
MIANRIRRVLVYTHNSIGLGHVFRTLAVITGIRKWRPDIDFMVLSGTSVPHVLMRQGIEVVKLPGIKKAVEETGCPLKPRYLRSLPVDEVLKFRQTIIREAHAFFKPDVVMVEHYLAGLSGEITPLLMEKKACKGSPKDFAMVHLSRGIMGSDFNLQRYPDDPCSLPVPPVYDFRYVFDEPSPVDTKGSAGGTPQIGHPVRYLGKIAEKSIGELPDRKVILTRFRLTDKPIILLYLSRHGNIADLSKCLMTAIDLAGLTRHYQIIMVADPYLNPEIIEDLRADIRFKPVRFLPFFYPLIDLIHASEIVICRAGYNVINEILLTDTRALVIPEHHLSGEQEERARLLPLDNIAVLSEEAALASPPAQVLLGLIKRKKTALGLNFDKYAIGRKIIDELEAWTALRRRVPFDSC